MLPKKRNTICSHLRLKSPYMPCYTNVNSINPGQEYRIQRKTILPPIFIIKINKCTTILHLESYFPPFLVNAGSSNHAGSTTTPSLEGIGPEGLSYPLLHLNLPLKFDCDSLTVKGTLQNIYVN